MLNYSNSVVSLSFFLSLSVTLSYELVSTFYADPKKGFLLIQTVIGDARQDSGEGAAGLTDSRRIQEHLGRIAQSPQVCSDVILCNISDSNHFAGSRTSKLPLEP
jgi:hypothetical protein